MIITFFFKVCKIYKFINKLIRDILTIFEIKIELKLKKNFNFSIKKKNSNKKYF